MLNQILDPVLNPLLGLPTIATIAVMAFIITLIITVIYKFTTDQSLMKDLKEEIKELQKQTKELRDHPEKMMEVQKRAMSTNMQYMKHSMRSTLFTFIPIILLFGWMNAHLAFEPIMPDQEFTTTVILDNVVPGSATIAVPDAITLKGDAEKDIQGTELKWVLSGPVGDYILDYEIGGRTYTKELKITNDKTYAEPIKVVKDKTVKEIKIDNEKMKVIGGLGWLWTYIIFSIVFSSILRKLFKVY